MAPARVEEPPNSWPAWSSENKSDAKDQEPIYKGRPRNLEAIDQIKFDPSLQPKQYEMFGTHPDSKILFTDV